MTITAPSITRNPIDPRFSKATALIVKVTHRCNVDCHYCYENIQGGADMSISTFGKLAEAALSSTSDESLLFIFHGGEPTLMPTSFYESAAEIAIAAAECYGKTVSFGMQSNFVSVADEKMEAFKRLGFSVSVSLDGPPGMVGSLRPKAEAATRNYLKAKQLGLRCGILMTINQGNWDKFDEILGWLESDLRATDFKANPVTAVGRGQAMPDLKPVQVFGAQTAILDYMTATRGLRVIEDNVSKELVRFFAPAAARRPNESLCRSQSCGAGRAVIGVAPDGSLLPCGRFQWDDAEYYLGRLDDTAETAGEAYRSAVERFHTLVPTTWHDCGSCDAKHICSFGCQAFIARSPNHANVECLPTKMRYEYFLKNRAQLSELATNLIEIRGDTVLAPTSSKAYSDDKYNDDKRYRDYSDYKDYTDKGPGKGTA